MGASRLQTAVFAAIGVAILLLGIRAVREGGSPAAAEGGTPLAAEPVGSGSGATTVNS